MTIETNHTIDPWIKEYVSVWRDRLHLWNAGIQIHITDRIQDDSNTMGLCEQRPNVLEYSLTFRSDIENNQEWRVVVIHEILHILFGRLDQVVDTVITPKIHDPVVKTMSWEVYSIQMEQVVHQLALALYSLTAETDFPHTTTP